MATIQMYTSIILTITFTATITAASGLKEVCQWETFEAKCKEDEVIMIKKAHYGRMGVGRCQPRDFGFAGCSADVSAIMHARCSGRQTCTVNVPDPTMFAATPCPKDLVTYLQTEYKCLKVAKSNVDNCDDQVLTALNGDIAKPLTNTKNLVCPHRILAQPGQTVNVYLYDFYNKDTNTEATPECISYGYVSEDSNMPTKICGGEFKKKHLIYSSDSNVVDITLAEASSHSNHYLLHYEVVGCPTLQAPPNSWMKVEDNTAIVMCNFSHSASNLVCSNNEWVGDIQNCTSIDTELLMASSLSVTSLSDIVANSGMFAIICVGLACGVLFGIGLLAFIRARQFKAKQILDLPQKSILEKPSLPNKEKSFKPVDQYQPVYVPITMDSHGQYAPVQQNNLYEVPKPNSLSPLQGSRLPVVENIYGRLSGEHVPPVHTCSHSIYNITGLNLDHDNVITVDNTLLN